MLRSKGIYALLREFHKATTAKYKSAAAVDDDNYSKQTARTDDVQISAESKKSKNGAFNTANSNRTWNELNSSEKKNVNAGFYYISDSSSTLDAVINILIRTDDEMLIDQKCHSLRTLTVDPDC